MRCLVIRMSSLGDVSLATAVLEPLREHFPSIDVIWLTRPPYGALLRDDPRISEVISWDRRRLFPTALLRVEGFDLVLDLHRIPRTWLISALLPARRRLGYSKARRHRKALVRGRTDQPVLHTVERYLEALAPLGVRAWGTPRVFVSGEAWERAETLLAGVSRPFVAVAPGARWPTKRWTSEGFARVIEELRARGIGAVLVGDERDRDFAGEVRTSCKVPSLVGRTDLPTLAGVLSMASVLLGNDSGPVHLANAVGTPAVAIFGPTHPKLGFAPLKGRALTVDLPCSPCSLHGERPCPRGDRVCIRGITTEDVLEALKELIP